MYLIRPPLVYRWLFKDAIFRKEERNTVYLTFDDGPHPEATEFVLDVLQLEGVKATFFMLGKNVLAQPKMFERVKKEGHLIANHGQEHLNGWATGTKEYLENCRTGKQTTGSNLFRPPYGRITLSQYNALKAESQLVFWDVISGDFDTANSADKVVKNVLNNVRKGSVIVFHDSAKALPKLRSALPEVIVELKKREFKFGVL